jgi:ketosteroid isomerase-like protein
MDSTRAQTIRNGLGAWSRGDLEGALGNIDPELVFLSSGLFVGVEPIYRGHEGFRQFWRDFREAWAQIAFEIEHLFEGERDQFAVVGRFEATGRDGIGVGRPIGMVFTTPGEAITRIQSFSTWEEAFEAAGVPPEARVAYR